MVAMVAPLGLTACKKDEGTPEVAAPQAAATTSATTEAAKESGAKVDKQGVQIEELVVGTGALATGKKSVDVHYTGWLTDGTKFDSSKDRGKPFTFTLDSGMVIKGWDIGVEGMKVGGKRKLTIPADKAYGDRGAGGVIPPGATLVFEVELLGVGA